MKLFDSRAAQYAAALLLVVGAAWTAVLADWRLGASDLSLIFVLPVVIAAARFGQGPALAAALAGTGAFNFLLVEPRHTFRIADPSNVWGVVFLGAVATIVSSVAAEARRRALESEERARQAATVESLARTLVGASGASAIAQAATEALASICGTAAAVLQADPAGVNLLAAAGGERPGAPDLEAAEWAMAADAPLRADAYPAVDARFDVWPIALANGRKVAVALRLGDRGDGQRPRIEQLVGIIGGHLADALARDAYASEAAEARLEAERERLKENLLAAVSHDFRTPLSTILLTLQSLRRFGEVHDAADRDALLGLAVAEAERLSHLVANLLDMSRLDAGAVGVRLAPCAPGELVAAARAHAATALAGRVVLESVPDEAPPVLADSSLMQAALGNVLENAGKYSPAGSQINITFRADDEVGVIEVEDQGVGFGAPAAPLFAKFARGVEGDGRPPGVGLGLAIAKGMLEAQGGRIEAEDREEGGARLRLILPLAVARATA